MRSSRTETTRFWRPIGLGGVELAYTSHGRHAFPGISTKNTSLPC
jgi:hypothetical protein